MGQVKTDGPPQPAPLRGGFNSRCSGREWIFTLWLEWRLMRVWVLGANDPPALIIYFMDYFVNVCFSQHYYNTTGSKYFGRASGHRFKSCPPQDRKYIYFLK